MKSIVYIIILVLSIMMLPSKALFAETPCTYLGHDKLEHARACMGSRRSTRHGSIIPLNRVRHVNHDPFYTAMSTIGTMMYGYRYFYNKRYSSPYHRTIYLSPLPTDIISYNE